ncbi:MAG: energy-coupling factor ABC transporter permease [Methanimicrococcus sp.]|nr:energy-coupling factor ABC transporter permease [Methanimicrococcus sp.]
MADALLSPAVGGIMILISLAAILFSVYKLKQNGLDEKKIPMMAVLGAFVFAAQMINFTIPGTGASGHIAGGILLAVLLGPYAGLIVLSIVLIIQCLFFGDGGLLAIGCNILNIGILSCFIAYPVIFKSIIKSGITPFKIMSASILSVVIGLQLGAFGVVVETLASGITELPFTTFVALMQPIHLVIGLVEGIITGSVLIYVLKERPELIENTVAKTSKQSVKKITAVLLVSALLIAGGLSLFASSHPDGLEWSIEGITGSTELEREGGIYDTAANIINWTAIMPDYRFKSDNGDGSALGTSTAGIVGSVLTLALAALIGYAVYYAAKRKKSAA